MKSLFLIALVLSLQSITVEGVDVNTTIPYGDPVDLWVLFKYDTRDPPAKTIMYWFISEVKVAGYNLWYDMESNYMPDGLYSALMTATFIDVGENHFRAQRTIPFDDLHISDDLIEAKATFWVFICWYVTLESGHVEPFGIHIPTKVKYFPRATTFISSTTAPVTSKTIQTSSRRSNAIFYVIGGIAVLAIGAIIVKGIDRTPKKSMEEILYPKTYQETKKRRGETNKKSKRNLK